MAEGEAEGEADSSAAAFFFVVFFADAVGDASVEADVFFVVEVFLAEVEVAWVVVAPVDVVASSFFWLWQPRNAASVSAVVAHGAALAGEDSHCVWSTELPEMRSRPAPSGDGMRRPGW